MDSLGFPVSEKLGVQSERSSVTENPRNGKRFRRRERDPRNTRMIRKEQEKEEGRRR
jgi:hypothetical protein